MTDEPRTSYYPTGIVRRLFTTPKADVETAVLSRPTRVAPFHRTHTEMLAAPQRNLSRRRLAMFALVLGLLASAFIAGRKSAYVGPADQARATPRMTHTDDAAKAQQTPQHPATPQLAEAPSRAIAIEDGTVADAVEALAVGNYPRALRLYHSLAAARPHEEVFATIASTLKRRLNERCADRSSTGDPACAEP